MSTWYGQGGKGREGRGRWGSQATVQDLSEHAREVSVSVKGVDQGGESIHVGSATFSLAAIQSQISMVTSLCSFSFAPGLTDSHVHQTLTLSHKSPASCTTPPNLLLRVGVGDPSPFFVSCLVQTLDFQDKQVAVPLPVFCFFGIACLRVTTTLSQPCVSPPVSTPSSPTCPRSLSATSSSQNICFRDRHRLTAMQMTDLTQIQIQQQWRCSWDETVGTLSLVLAGATGWVCFGARERVGWRTRRVKIAVEDIVDIVPVITDPFSLSHSLIRAACWTALSTSKHPGPLLCFVSTAFRHHISHSSFSQFRFSNLLNSRDEIVLTLRKLMAR